MHDFIMVEDSELWDVICDGPFVPMKTVGEGTVTVPKTRKEYNDADRKAIEKNFREKKILVCGIGPDEYHRISACQSAKEILEALQTTHEGTTQKILSVLPGSWESNVNAITEAKDLQKLTIDELIGNLKTYEMNRNNDLKRREPKKEKNLVLKAANKHSSSDESDMEYLTRRFQKMIRKNGGIPKKRSSSRNFKENDCCHRKFNRRDVTNNMLKQALFDWGNSSSESEGENMMVDDNGSSEYESIFALMAKSNDDEDKEEDERDYIRVSIVDLEETIESMKKEKEVLTDSNANIEHERDDLLVLVVKLKETIGELKMKSRPENSQKEKEVTSEAHIKLESELNSVKSSLCGELERNKQLQEELGRVKSDLEKSLKWT
uniref:Uncharacterized protein LOC104213861 n=1 Tax=Nicotiana sylvestris TaxID=4096 RepID=A0A1U7V9Q7_NICSY|nr:PREDICTED: uncharacterized protein LOC104213861 [Nicotiana sylvestris]